MELFSREKSKGQKTDVGNERNRKSETQDAGHNRKTHNAERRLSYEPYFHHKPQPKTKFACIIAPSMVPLLR